VSEVRVLALIPARGGSKGIPRKNLAVIGGHPLIAHTIRTARASGRLTRIVVSTDDQDISEVARRYGADVPFLRPPELATDQAKSADVVLHALAAIETQEARQYDVICLLEPTSPLRTIADVSGALDMLTSSDADAVISVYRVEAPHPIKTLAIEGNRLAPFMPERWKPNLTRQELPPVYAVNGAVYCIRRDAFLASRSFWGSSAAPYVMPQERSVNIDTPLDLTVADVLLKQRGQQV
jgi:CMP-N,N'-diacetyllegionaminic acid synthase